MIRDLSDINGTDLRIRAENALKLSMQAKYVDIKLYIYKIIYIYNYIYIYICICYVMPRVLYQIYNH